MGIEPSNLPVQFLAVLTWLTANGPILLIVICGWLVITGVLSCLAGWPVLTKRFRATQSTQGESFWCASGSIGVFPWFSVNHVGCLFLVLNATGFRLSVTFPFCFLSPALFIHWEQIEKITEESIWFRQHTIIHIKDSDIKIMLRGGVAEAIPKVYKRFCLENAL